MLQVVVELTSFHVISVELKKSLNKQKQKYKFLVFLAFVK